LSFGEECVVASVAPENVILWELVGGGGGSEADEGDGQELLQMHDVYFSTLPPVMVVRCKTGGKAGVEGE